MFDEIRKLLVECANVHYEEIKPNSRLKEDLGIDSLQSVELVLQLETNYDIVIDWDETKPLITVNDICKLVDSKRNR